MYSKAAWFRTSLLCEITEYMYSVIYLLCIAPCSTYTITTISACAHVGVVLIRPAYAAVEADRVLTLEITVVHLLKAFIRVCSREQNQSPTHPRAHTNKHTRTQTNTHTHTNIDKQTHAHKHQTNTHTRIPTEIPTQTHIQWLPSSPPRSY